MATVPDRIEILETFHGAVRRVDLTANARRGAKLDVLGGSSSVLWVKQMDRDEYLFRLGDVLDENDRFDALVDYYYRPRRTRRPERPGQGSLIMSRPSAGTDGYIYTGTRIIYTPGQGQESRVYSVSTDTPVSITDTTVNVPIESTLAGRSVPVEALESQLKVDDILFDPSFKAIYMTCDAGENEESRKDYLAFAKTDHLAQRNGYATKIRSICAEVGAFQIVLLRPDEFGDEYDDGICHLYVADANWSWTQDLVKACVLATDGVRIGGCDLSVGGIQTTPIQFSVNVTVRASMSPRERLSITPIISDAIIRNFQADEAFWRYDLGWLESVVVKTSPRIQEATVTTNQPAPTPGFQQVLPRYVPTTIAVTIGNPT